MSVHQPILVTPIVEALVEGARIAPDSWIWDATLGGGGHTQALLTALERAGLQRVRVLSTDQDPAAVEAGKARFADLITQGRLEIAHSAFGELPSGSRVLVGAMADLGFSSDQIESSDRGLSFKIDGPLDMRLDPTRGEPCSAWLARAREAEIAEVIFELGEERFSRRIARAIVEARASRALPNTSAALAELVRRAVPGPARAGRIHPATRTFQAFRIWVNDELGELDRLLSGIGAKLVEGGRLAILSFHSLEDRRVKSAFKTPPWRALTKKPIEADALELQSNPRSRSAKLRIAEKTGDLF